MTIEWYDYVGTSGVSLILLAYFLLQSERLASTTLAYSVLNLLGASFIAISLLFDFNLSAMVIEICWAAISIYGIMRHVRERENSRPHNAA
jgi:predicted membrane protein